jgi:hypothetical protein
VHSSSNNRKLRLGGPWGLGSATQHSGLMHAWRVRAARLCQRPSWLTSLAFWLLPCMRHCRAKFSSTYTALGRGVITQC